MQKTLCLLFFLISSFCFAQKQKKVEIHGHRGFRGQYPENTLIAFKEAAKAGADHIELDVIISKDSQVFVSHEPWFNPKTCSDPEGKKISRSKKGNLHQLNYSEIKKYDCGKRGNKKFPQQIKTAEYKPLLSEVIETLEHYTSENNLNPIKYTIEIKSKEKRNYYFEQTTTANLVYGIIKSHNISERIIIQSFDVKILREIHQLNNLQKIGLLTANFRTVEHNLKKLYFTPHYYNPYYRFCKTKTIRDAHKKGCKVVVWTVNSEADQKRLIEMGVDGIITDFPNLAQKYK